MKKSLKSKFVIKCSVAKKMSMIAGILLTMVFCVGCGTNVLNQSDSDFQASESGRRVSVVMSSPAYSSAGRYENSSKKARRDGKNFYSSQKEKYSQLGENVYKNSCDSIADLMTRVDDYNVIMNNMTSILNNLKSQDNAQSYFDSVETIQQMVLDIESEIGETNYLTERFKKNLQTQLSVNRNEMEKAADQALERIYSGDSQATSQTKNTEKTNTKNNDSLISSSQNAVRDWENSDLDDKLTDSEKTFWLIMLAIIIAFGVCGVIFYFFIQHYRGELGRSSKKDSNKQGCRGIRIGKSKDTSADIKSDNAHANTSDKAHDNAASFVCDTPSSTGRDTSPLSDRSSDRNYQHHAEADNEYEYSDSIIHSDYSHERENAAYDTGAQNNNRHADNMQGASYDFSLFRSKCNEIARIGDINLRKERIKKLMNEYKDKASYVSCQNFNHVYNSPTSVKPEFVKSATFTMLLLFDSYLIPNPAMTEKEKRNLSYFAIIRSAGYISARTPSIVRKSGNAYVLTKKGEWTN